MHIEALATEAGLWQERHGVFMALGGLVELEKFAELVRRSATESLEAELAALRGEYAEPIAFICENRKLEWNPDSRVAFTAGTVVAMKIPLFLHPLKVAPAVEPGKCCEPCRSTGLFHCSDPANCGGPWDDHAAPSPTEPTK